MKKQISFLIYSIIIGGLIFSSLNASIAHAAIAVDSGFNPNKIIDDKLFSDSKTMSASDIQKFLQEKGSVLSNTSNSFISQLREPVGNSALKQTLEDPKTDNSTPRTAAELIYDASSSAGINPQVILVTLNKEQSLITGRQNSTPEQIQRALDFAMGFGCPDSQPCGEIYKGFYGQLFGGVDSEGNRYLGATRSLMKSFSTSGGRGPFYNGATSKVGDTITLGNTTGDYEGVQSQQTITLGNSATAALYRYTPHVFNGNYNFWRFFKAWFGSPSSGSDSSSSGVVKSGSDYYIIEGSTRYLLYDFVAEAHNIKTSKAKKLSSTRLKQYGDGGVYAAPDNTVIKYEDNYYRFESNKKIKATEQELKDRGLSVKRAISVDKEEFNAFKESSASNPTPTPTPAPTPTPTPTPTPSGSLNEGDVVKTNSNPAVYLLDAGKLKMFTYATFVQYGALTKLKVVSDSDINKYPKEGLVLPKAGSLVKAFNSQTVFFYEDGKKKPMDAEIFRNRGFSFTNVYELTQEVIDALPLGPFPLPKDNTFFQDKKTGQLWWYTAGKKRSISAFVAKQKGITPDFTFGEDTINNLANGNPVMPKEGTVFKSDKKADVYIVNANVAFPMTADAFKARGIAAAAVNILPQAEVDGYPKGSLLTK